MASLEKTTEMASGYSPCDPTCGGTNLASCQPQSKTHKDISQDRGVAPVRSGSGMAQRESSFELLGVDWPEPEDRMAQGRPLVDGTRQRPWRRQDETQAGWPGSGPAEHSRAGGTGSRSLRAACDWQRGGGMEGRLFFQNFPILLLRDSLGLFALLSLHVPTSKQTCSEGKLA